MKRTVGLVAMSLLALDLASAQSFGGAVAATESHVMVGEIRNHAFPGEVYIYARDDGWQAPLKLKVSEVPDRFGRALAADGRTLLVGASAEDNGTGAVYVYAFDGTWTLQSRLVPVDVQEGDQFGTSVALHGDVAVIGAVGRDERAGIAYVFERGEDGLFAESQELTSASLTANDQFGAAVAVGAHFAVVAAPTQASSTGAAYAFVRKDGKWQERGVLSTGIERSRAGASVAVNGGMIFVGAPMANQMQGLVVVYGPDDESGEIREVARLMPFDGVRGSRFGSSVLADEGELWVGAPGADLSGTVYAFTREGDRWLSAQKVFPDGVSDRVMFGDALAVAGDVAVAGATRIDYGEGGAMILERTGGTWAQQSVVVSDIKGRDAISGGDVRCEEGMIEVWSCAEVDLVSFVPTREMGGGRGTRTNDIWGWTDSEPGREYALVGRNDGMSIVDVTDANMPVYVGDLPMTAGSRANVWRDIKVYRDHAYVVADGAGEHGVQVLDLRQIRELSEIPVTFKETVLYSGIHSAHNIVINEDTGFGFVVGSSGGGQTCGGGLHMIDLRDVPNVTFAGCFADPTTGRRKTGYSHDAQCVIYHGPDAAYQGREICLGSNETALSIADVTDKENPVPLAMADYPKVAYTHQGWLTEDHRYFYMNDEGDEPQGLVEGTRTLVWDVSDLDDPVLVNEYIAETTTTDHNLYVRGNLMYQSNYGSGLRILDITNPVEPVEIGFFDTAPADAGGASWSNYPFFESGNIIVTSGSQGLFVIKRRAVDT
ncbi:MAG: choice-of-anchor B family protein [Bacteroidota bacterium]|nr:choice-of-anchor B family protein [Bacteroidota bacterium]